MNGQSLFRELTIFMGLVSLDVMSMHKFTERISWPPHQDSNAEGLKTCLNTLHLGVDQHCKQGSKMNIMIKHKQQRVLNNIIWFSSCTDNAENVCIRISWRLESTSRSIAASWRKVYIKNLHENPLETWWYASSQVSSRILPRGNFSFIYCES